MLKSTNGTPGNGGRNVEELRLPQVRIVGPGRAGTSLALALSRAGWPAPELVARDAVAAETGRGADFLVIATPDAAIASVAAAIEPDATTVVVHLAGCYGLDVLAPHPRRAT